MAHTISDARISLNRCNKILERMGCERRLSIWTQRDGGRGSRRLVWDDNHEIGGRCTDAEIERVLTGIEAVLMEVSHD